jgi:hypothetical protein
MEAPLRLLFQQRRCYLLVVPRFWLRISEVVFRRFT